MLLLPELLSSGSNVILKNDLFSSYYSYAVVLRILSFSKNDKISIIYYLNSIDIRN
nr:MAG TPA: hypothetical protein [Caudoviricetes sp.]